MKKMLLTTALVGSLVSGISSANAEVKTSVTGNLAISYFAAGSDSTSQTSKSYNGFGTESQINLAGTGDLNNGLKYAAGFSWEIDGGESLGSGTGSTANAKSATEGTYIEFINGKTVVGVGADRVANLDGTGSNFVGFGYRYIAGIYTSIANTTYNDAYNQFGIYAKQGFNGGSFAVVYTPNSGATNIVTDDIGVSSAKTTVDAGPSSFTVGFQGDLGVKGLGVKAGYASETKLAPGYKDTTGNVVSVDYQMGATKVGLTRGTTTNGYTSEDRTTLEAGIAQAISDTTSVGLAYTRTDSNLSTKPENEVIVTASIGYNMGPVALTLQYKDSRDTGGVAGQDATQLGMYLGTKF